MELLRDFPESGNFNYFDEQKEEHVEGMAVFPEIKIGAEITRKVNDDTQG